jgi:ElaB/YqjD/DUF883 family membrane-anchored ribosome-binding protein
MNDLKGLVADGDDLLQELVRSTNEDFAVARARIERRLGDARARLDHARLVVGRKVGRAADSTVDYALENPWKIAGVAVATVLITAFVMSRR